MGRGATKLVRPTFDLGGTNCSFNHLPIEETDIDSQTMGHSFQSMDFHTCPFILMIQSEVRAHPPMEITSGEEGRSGDIYFGS